MAADRDPAGPDLVVGADGIWSATRAALDPAAPRPAYSGIYSVSGTSAGLPPGPSCARSPAATAAGRC